MARCLNPGRALWFGWLCLGAVWLWTGPAKADTNVAACTELALRNALAAAAAGAGTVTFSQPCTINLAAPIAINSDTRLDGRSLGVQISSTNSSTALFTVASGVSLTLSGLTLANGQSPTGGALYINPGATVILTNCILSGNRASGGNGVDGADGSDSASGNGGNGRNGTAGSPGYGGAVYNLGALTLLNCTVATNTATGGNGGNGGNGGSGRYNGGNGGTGAPGAPAWGGAIYNLGTLVLSNCTFAGNSVLGGAGGAGGASGAGAFAGLAGSGAPGAAASGGGVFSTNGNITLVNCTFVGNVAQAGSGTAGGTQVNGSGTTGSRGGDGSGGGICNGGGSGILTNCTFSGNKATAGNGGDGGDARWAGGAGGNGGNATGGGCHNNSGAFTIVNCTLSTCGAFGGTNGFGGSGVPAGPNGQPGQSRGGNVAHTGGAFTLKNTILSSSPSGGNGYDTSASRIGDAGNNISSDASPAFAGGSRNNTDPRLAALAANGGPTQTIMLLPGSPAVGAADDAAAPPFDQRGVVRPSSESPHGDIGSVEGQRPWIYTQPLAEQAKPVGGSVSFAVDARGDAPILYAWQFAGSAIAGATNSTYTLSNLTTTNQGNYSVIVSNAFGGLVSSNAHLTMALPPGIAYQPVATQAVAAGSLVQFSVGVTSTPPFTFQWMLNGTNSVGTTANVYAPSNSLVTTNTLTLAHVQPAGAGLYTVVVTSAGGAVTSSPARLLISVPDLYITVPPTNRTVAVGGSAPFTVGATGTPPLGFQWFFSNSPLAGATDARLVVRNAQYTNAGPYFAVVTNASGAVTSVPGWLKVLTQPYLSQPTLTQSNFTFSFLSETNATYLLQYKNTLSDPNWVSVATNPGTGGTLVLTSSVLGLAVPDPTQTSTVPVPSRYFRLLLW